MPEDVALRDCLIEALRMACHWVGDIAQVEAETTGPDDLNSLHYPYEDWRGAIRNEYFAATRKWDFFGTIWHTGQAVKALSLASGFIEKDYCLSKARAGAGFILRNRLSGGEDDGCILAYEDNGDKLNTSAILECLDGLFVLADVSGEPAYRDAALRAADWTLRKAYVPEEGQILDLYDHRTREFAERPYRRKDDSPGRPLLDDAIFLKAYGCTGDRRFEEAAVAIAERLVRDENPAGNWVDYTPCNPETGLIHPRQAWWWAHPMLAMHRHTGDKRYLDVFLRSTEWYSRAMRRDGGMLRRTFTDFSTESFGHATSGLCCSITMFADAIEAAGDWSLLDHLSKGLGFALGMQFTRAEDSNLRGAILEKVLPPDGTDRLPYHVRDLGTIFFIQAAVRLLRDEMILERLSALGGW